MYQKLGGGFLDGDNAVNYLTALINMAHERWKADASRESKAFFDCLDPKMTASASSTWLKGLQGNMRRIGKLREFEAGEELDKSAKSIGMSHVSEMARQLARKGTSEAVARKLAILTLWTTAGRSGEPANISYEGLDCDEDARCTAADMGCNKVRLPTVGCPRITACVKPYHPASAAKLSPPETLSGERL